LVSYIKERTLSEYVESRMLRRRIFEAKRKKIMGSWKNLHNEEFHNLYTSPNIIRVMK
jgi:hypothetical protein